MNPEHGGCPRPASPLSACNLHLALHPVEAKPQHRIDRQQPANHRSEQIARMKGIASPDSRCQHHRASTHRAERHRTPAEEPVDRVHPAQQFVAYQGS